MGITISGDLVRTLESNYLDIIEKTKNIMQSWKHRGSPLTGKILVINSLIGSLFVYRVSVLSNIPQRYINQFYELVENFLWGEGKPKVTTDILMLPKDQGGMQLVNLGAKQDSLKIKWAILARENLFFAEVVGNNLIPD